MKIYVVSSQNSNNNYENVISYHATFKGAYHYVKDAINFVKEFDDGIKDIVGIYKADIAGRGYHRFVCTTKTNKYDYVALSISEEELGP